MNDVRYQDKLYPTISKLGLRVELDDRDTVLAPALEKLLAAAPVAYGCGDERSFSLVHAPAINKESFEVRGIVLGLEATGYDTTKAVAMKLKQALATHYVKCAKNHGGETLQEVLALVEQLVKKVGV